MKVFVSVLFISVFLISSSLTYANINRREGETYNEFCNRCLNYCKYNNAICSKDKNVWPWKYVCTCPDGPKKIEDPTATTETSNNDIYNSFLKIMGVETNTIGEAPTYDQNSYVEPSTEEAPTYQLLKNAEPSGTGEEPPSEPPPDPYGCENPGCCFCLDTDKVNNHFVTGAVSWVNLCSYKHLLDEGLDPMVNESSWHRALPDECMSGADEGKVLERYCADSGGFAELSFECPNGCANGVCKPLDVETTDPAPF